MSAVPTVYATLAQLPVDADIGSLRVAMVGASPLPAAVRDAFQAHTGVRLLEGYGLTEATCASARSFPDAPRPGSVGQRLPYQRMAVRADGVLAISGPTVFPGYVTGREDRPRPGRHGQAGRRLAGHRRPRPLDEDGFVYLPGRAKDLIIRGGHNIDPAIIEDALLAHPQVPAAAAVGRPDAHAGEVPVAYVTLAPGPRSPRTSCAPGRPPGRRARRRAQGRHRARPATGHRGRQAVQAAAARRRHPPRRRRRRRAAESAEVDAHIEDGSVVVTVTVPPACDRNAITAALDAFAVRWHLRVTQDAS